MQPPAQMSLLQTIGLWAAITGPFVVLFLTLYLQRRFKRADESRAALAKKAEDDRAAVAKKSEEDRLELAKKAEQDRSATISLLHQIKGAVEVHGEQLVAVRTRVDGHDKEFDRIYTGIFAGLNRRVEPNG